MGFKDLQILQVIFTCSYLHAARVGLKTLTNLVWTLQLSTFSKSSNQSSYKPNLSERESNTQVVMWGYYQILSSITIVHMQPDTAAFSNTSLHLLLRCYGFWRAKHLASSLKSSLETIWYNVSGSRRDDKYLNTFTPETLDLIYR